MAYTDKYAGRATETEQGDLVQGEQIEELYNALGPDPLDGASDIGERISNIEASLGGTADAAHTHDAAAFTTGVISPDRLGVNSGADLFLRGDGTWAYPSADAQGLKVLNDGEDIPESVPIGWIILRRGQA